MSFATKLLFSPLLIKEMHKTCKKAIQIIENFSPDVIIINTFHSPVYLKPLIKWLIEGKKSSKKILFIIHNSQLWGKSHFKKSEEQYKNLAKYLYLYINNKMMESIKKKLPPKIDGVITLDKYVTLPKILKTKKRFVMPNRLSNGYLNQSQEKNNIDTINFIVPGTVDTVRRNYKLIFNTFNLLLKNNPYYSKKIRLILLGKLSDPNIKKEIIFSPIKTITKFYESFVEEAEFDCQFTNAHYTIISTNSNSPYGKYKISGALGDSFAYGIPVFLPVHFAQFHSFGKNVIRYDEKSFYQLVFKEINQCLENCSYYKDTFETSTYLDKKRRTSHYVSQNFEKYLNSFLFDSNIEENVGVSKCILY
jgi:hypothetical protein